MSELSFDNMIHYSVNILGPDDDVAACRRYLASCPEGGRYTMFDVDKLVPLPDGVEKNSLEAELFRAVNLGCSKLYNVREDGLNTIYFDNGNYLMEPVVFEKIVEKFPSLHVAVIEGMDSEYGRGSTVTGYEYQGGTVISDILYTTYRMNVAPPELGNRDPAKASYLQYMAENSSFVVFLNQDECRACGVRTGAMMYPDGSVNGLKLDEEVELVLSGSSDKVRSKQSLER